jgi:tetratricopeptide (TPR) repeat protein
MNIQTLNADAFNNVALAVESIEKYNASKEVGNLEEAESALQKAMDADPDFLDVHFYSGLTLDLIGKPKDAALFFERIYNEIDAEKIKDEAQYNLGVAYYHLYSHRFLKIAETNFLEVIAKTKDENLKYLSMANLAQTYAMWMIPSSALKKDWRDNEDQRRAIVQSASDNYAKFKECEGKVRRFLTWDWLSPGIKKADKNKIRAIINNAKGMALMYGTDYSSEDNGKKKEILNEALSYLQKSDAEIPNDWANSCDLASATWRLSMVESDTAKAQELFDKSIELLKRVTQVLRRNYGFALYELGRIYRTKKEFATAIKYFEEAMAIEVDYRDVSDQTVLDEKERAKKADSSFP